MSSPVSPGQTFVVLAGHGSRSLEANAALANLANGMQSQLGLPVRHAFLEMAEPSIAVALRAAAFAGARRVVLVPYFLSPGMHVRRDLVALIDEGRRELGLPIEMGDFFGAHPEVPRLLVELAREALARRDVKTVSGAD